MESVTQAIKRIDTALRRTGAPPPVALRLAAEVAAEIGERFGHLGAKDQLMLAAYVADVTAGLTGGGGNNRLAAGAWAYSLAASRLAEPLRGAAS